MRNSWTLRLKKAFRLCRNEVQKTTQISKKMLSASRTSSELCQAYQELGNLAFEDLKREVLDWKNPKVKKLMTTIEEFESSLQHLEEDVNQLKKCKGSSLEQN